MHSPSPAQPRAVGNRSGGRRWKRAGSGSGHPRDTGAGVRAGARNIGRGERLTAVLSRIPAFAQGASTCSVGRSCRAASRPPRMIWNTWAMNSISRIPPGPSLTWSAMSRRATCERIWRMQSAHGIDRAEIQVLAEHEGPDDGGKFGQPCRLPRIQRARLDPGVPLPLPALGDEIVFEACQGCTPAARTRRWAAAACPPGTPGRRR